MPRNRSAEARAKGRRLIAIEITADADSSLAALQAGLADRLGTCTQAQAVEYALRAAAKKFSKKSATGLDTD